MTQFLDSLLTRHTDIGGNVKPRLRSRFEPAAQPSAFAPGFAPSDSQNTVFSPESDDTAFSAANQVRGKSGRSAKVDPEQDHPPRLNSTRLTTNRLNDHSNQEPLSWPDSLIRSQTQDTLSHRATVQPHQEGMPAAGRPAGQFVFDSAVGKPARQTARSEGTESAPAQNRRQGILGVPPAWRTTRQASDLTSSSTSEQAIPLPTIRVTIGRIDVRAIQQPASPAARSSAGPTPKLSLDDYLKQRNKRDL